MNVFYRQVFFLSPNCFFFVTFPRDIAQIVRRGRSTYVLNIFFHSFCTFKVMTHCAAEESFLNKYLSILFEYSSWNLNIVVCFSCRVLLTTKSISLLFKIFFLQRKSPMHSVDQHLETLKVFSFRLHVALQALRYEPHYE